MSSSSSQLAGALALVVALVVAAPAARALSVHAVYRTACSREVGVILKVEKRKIYLLRLDGTLVQIDPLTGATTVLPVSLGRFTAMEVYE